MENIEKKVNHLNNISKYIKKEVVNKKTYLSKENIRRTNENIYSDIVLLAVKQLSMLITHNIFSESFYFSLQGIKIRKELFNLNTEEGLEYPKFIKGADEKSIFNSVMFSYYGDWYKKEIMESYESLYLSNNNNIISMKKIIPKNENIRVGIDLIEPNKETIDNISHMIDTTVFYLDTIGDVERVNYQYILRAENTKSIISGYIDVLTDDTLIYMTDKKDDNKNLLIAMSQYVAGLKAEEIVFKNIKYITVYNTRENYEIKIPVDMLDTNLISLIKKNILV